MKLKELIVEEIDIRKEFMYQGTAQKLGGLTGQAVLSYTTRKKRENAISYMDETIEKWKKKSKNAFTDKRKEKIDAVTDKMEEVVEKYKELDKSVGNRDEKLELLAEFNDLLMSVKRLTLDKVIIGGTLLGVMIPVLASIAAALSLSDVTHKVDVDIKDKQKEGEKLIDELKDKLKELQNGAKEFRDEMKDK